MKTPILLKILQSCHAKATPNFPKTRSRKGDQGFTLLEVLVTVLVLGILSSIAAPSWLAFINNQRVRTVNDRVLQSLRSAQSEAKRTKRDVTVTFYTSSSTPSVDPPRVEIDTNPAETDTSKKEIRKETFSSGGEIKPGTIALTVNQPAASTPANSITFDYQGNLPTNTTPFYVTVAPASGGQKKCVIVQTILGAMTTDEGTFDTNTKQGCK
ncbi:transcriptional regulator [Tychonema bourrellyi FEM_GT703]|uniref:Transcriptional regulator n=1 Tax=Tychonema bourrellyi FEM_GT703 TaxID=2040638 RepID=A0A2G4F0U7_9CYAN|nr:GspH/FimT family pseudopilin [Tychonema bourrellyi]PHX55383.1 transcriptional regulator [Tychonema bourrellyi FEM_GT703]